MIKLNLSSSQKQQLLRLYNSSNDSFFTFLNSADYEKKMKKLSNAKDAYAFYAYDEEPLFLLDDTDFGSADDGMVISNKSIYWRNTFGDPYEVKFEELYWPPLHKGTKCDMRFKSSLNSARLNLLNPYK